METDAQAAFREARGSARSSATAPEAIEGMTRDAAAAFYASLGSPCAGVTDADKYSPLGATGGPRDALGVGRSCGVFSGVFCLAAELSAIYDLIAEFTETPARGGA